MNAEKLPLTLGVCEYSHGKAVRLEGAHAYSGYITNILEASVPWATMWPETNTELRTPQPTLRFAEKEIRVFLKTYTLQKDCLDLRQAFTDGKAPPLQELPLDGIVIKNKLPFCGLEKIQGNLQNGISGKTGGAVFAQAVRTAFPLFPTEEETCLQDPERRDQFIGQVLSRNRWRKLEYEWQNRQRLVAFHTSHKLLLSSHSEQGMRSLGRLTAAAGNVSARASFEQYRQEFHRAILTPTSRKKHANVLMHAMGHLKTSLASADKRKILLSIEDYRLGRLPRTVPINLLRHNIRKYEITYLKRQVYFAPHPRDWRLGDSR